MPDSILLQLVDVFPTIMPHIPIILPRPTKQDMANIHRHHITKYYVLVIPNLQVDLTLLANKQLITILQPQTLYGIGCFVFGNFNFSITSMETKLSMLPPSMITFQHLPCTLHTVLNNAFHCGVSSTSLTCFNNTYLITRASLVSGISSMV